MSRTIDQVERLIALIPYLQANPGVSVKQVAEDFGVRPQLIKNDVKKLFMCGLPGGMPDDLIDLDSDALENQGVIKISNAEFLSAPMRLFRDEAVSLVLALQSMYATADEPTRALIDSAVSKLDAALGADRVVSVHLAPVDESIRSAVLDAARHGTQLDITYTNIHRDSENERTIEPLEVFQERGFTYVSAWCHQAQDHRNFRLDAMRSATSTGQAAVGPRKQRDVSARYSPADDDFWADFVISTDAEWLRDVYATEVLDENASLVRIHSHSPDWLLRFALRHSHFARLVGPEELVEQLRGAARSALSAYDGV